MNRYFFSLLIFLLSGLPLSAQVVQYSSFMVSCPTESQPGSTVSCSVSLSAQSAIDSMSFQTTVAPGGAAPGLTSAQLTFNESLSGASKNTGGSHDSITVAWTGLSLSPGSNQPVGSLSFIVPSSAIQGQAYSVTMTHASSSLGASSVYIQPALSAVVWVGHAGIVCETNAAVVLALRREGYTERLGDITFSCTGGDALPLGSMIPTMTVQLFLNTAVTSRLLPIAGGLSNLSEAVLLIDEPGSGLAWPGGNGPFGPNAPQTVCPTPVTGCMEYVSSASGILVATNAPQGSTASVAGYNVFQGTVSGNSVTFAGVPVLAPVQAGHSRVFRITNLRGNGSSFSDPGEAGVQMVIASASISSNVNIMFTNPTPTVGFVQNGLTTSTVGRANLTQCVSQTKAAVTTLRFTENFGTSFKTRVAAQTNTLYSGQSGNPPQNTPGAIYASESGLVISSTAAAQTAGIADFGTRLKAAFSNIPPGVRLFVSATNVLNAAVPVTPPAIPGGAAANVGTTGFAVLVSGELSAFSPVASTDFAPGDAGSVPVVEIPVLNGSASAVWEVVNTDPNRVESLQFGVYTTYASNPPANSPRPGMSAVSLSYGPVVGNGGAASNSLPISRFIADSNPATNLMEISSCAPAFAITKVHSGNFARGQVGATYTVTVSNAAMAAPTSGMVTVMETLPAGLAPVSMTGAGWTCPGTAANNCTRTDVLSPGASYPPITVTVNVAADATSMVVNNVSVSGGGSMTATGSDPTTITPVACSYGIQPGNATLPATGANGTVTVSTSTGCPWSANSDAGWLSVNGGASGNGSGTVSYTAIANSTPLQRTANLTIGGQTFTVTQQSPVATNTEAFVRQLYLDILSRTADPAGLNTWVGWINSGQFTRAQVASQFFQSAEFNLSGSYITKLYLAIMLRDPDYGGWTGWFNYLRAGHSQEEILNNFLNSQEFQLRYGNLDDTSFVTLVYNNVLHRAPDPAGLAQWIAWLNSGAYTRAQVMNGFVTSAEFDARVRNRVYANLLYVGFLRRVGEPAGLGGWTNWLNNATLTLDQEVNGFITSPEYLARF